MQTNHNFPKKKSIRGSTLVEVLMSVFLLTFGVLALMAAQIRSVGSIAEAENRSIVSQAVEALAEGMQLNPSIDASGERSYKEYAKSKVELEQGDSSTSKIGGLTGTNVSKKELAKMQLDDFQTILRTQVPNISKISYSICQDSTPDNPQIDANGVISDDNCDGSGVTAIKVAWRVENKNAKGNSTDYVYLLQVAN